LFFLGKKEAKDAMDEAFQKIDIDIVRLLRTQYGITMINQVDHIQMITVSMDDLDNYSSCSKWSYVISSVYALRKIGEYVTLEDCKELCRRSNAINDPHLFGIAFETHIHTMARTKMPIHLKIWEYNPIKS